ncbi:MAG: hypothetical protein IPP43_15235 [Chitinophagaceae bacterium]|nr:hypothetical protein [Chitinophagaceae bacterium]
MEDCRYSNFIQPLPNPKAGTTVLGGLQDNTVRRYNGTNCQKIIGCDGGPCMFKPDNENIVLGSNDTRFVSASINNGTSFPSTALAYLVAFLCHMMIVQVLWLNCG